MVKIHFLNVGYGDCTIVHFPERTRKDGKTKSERIMMIDLYHHDDHKEYEHIIDYYKKNFQNSNGSLNRFFVLPFYYFKHCDYFSFLQSQGKIF